jgi:uncharacterized protein (TIGR00369 family)
LGRIIGNGAGMVGKAFGITRVPVVKNQSMPAYDPRAVQGIGVTYATTTMGADHTAGYAAYTTVSEAFRILTIEFKINFFKPAVGKHIVCRSKVVNNGKNIKVSESEIFSRIEDQEKLVAKAMVTLIAIPSSNLT